jgi:two-component SAPR family response regulator
MPHRVIIVEDELLISKQIEVIIKKLGYIHLGTFANSDIFLDKIPSLRPDIILFDINIKGVKMG